MYLFTPVTQPGHTHKFTHMWDGVFEIQALAPPRALLFNPNLPDLPTFWVHVNRLRPFVPRAPRLASSSTPLLPVAHTKPKPPPSASNQPTNQLIVTNPPTNQPHKYMTRFQKQQQNNQLVNHTPQHFQNNHIMNAGSTSLSWSGASGSTEVAERWDDY